MLLALAALLAALWAGLVRLGWGIPVLVPALPAAHGPLMVSGFLGTVIGLERAVALRRLAGRPWSRLLLAGPILTGVGALLLLAGWRLPWGLLLLLVGSAGLVLAHGLIGYRHPAAHTLVMALGALLWLGGNALWLAGLPLHRVVWWWAGFLVWVVAGERLELARVLRLGPAARRLFAFLALLYALGLLVALARPAAGLRLLGLALAGLGLWLLWFDVARRTVRQAGLRRYVAVALLAGYGWLVVDGLLILRVGLVAAGPAYDALLHALFVGFILSLVLGHAPLILPALTGRSFRYRPCLYLPLLLLHFSLLLRLSGDLWPWVEGRRLGGLLNEVAFLAALPLLLASLRHSAQGQE